MGKELALTIRYATHLLLNFALNNLRSILFFFSASVCSMAIGNYHKSDVNTKIISKLVPCRDKLGNGSDVKQYFKTIKTYACISELILPVTVEGEVCFSFLCIEYAYGCV